MQPSRPIVYLVLGASGSGRREIVADLIAGGLEQREAAVLVAESESPAPADERLPGLARWAWREGAIVGTLPAGVARVFLISDGRLNPMDQIEAFRVWLLAQQGELARVLTVVNCALVEKNPPLLAWFDACIHFSDAVLLTRREGVANKWLGDFIERYRGQFYPCVIEMVKAGHVKNPALILEPQARRISQFFDEAPVVDPMVDEETIIEGDDDPEDEEDEDKPVEELWLARDATGRRERPLPDITKYLPSA